MVGLFPYAARKEHLLALGRVVEPCLRAEKEVFLHSQTHIDDSGFLLVGEVPAHFLVDDTLHRGLLHLHLEYLAIVAGLFWQHGELRGLHVEFGGSASHAHHLYALVQTAHTASRAVGRQIGDEAAHACAGSAVGAARRHIELHGSACAVGRSHIRPGHDDGFGIVKDFVVVGVQRHSHRAVVIAHAYRHVGSDFSRRRFCVHAVVFHHHRLHAARSGAARNLVDRRRHGTDTHYFLVDAVSQQAGGQFACKCGGEDFRSVCVGVAHFHLIFRS